MVKSKKPDDSSNGRKRISIMENTEHDYHFITRLLDSWNKGDNGALSQLMDALLPALKGTAHNTLLRFYHNRCFNTDELVQEATIKLIGKQNKLEWQSRKHFLRVMAKAMEHAILDEIRKGIATKRGKDFTIEKLDCEPESEEVDCNTVLAIGQALEHLEKVKPELAELVRFRYYLGYTIKDTAAILGVPLSRTNAMWRIARALLADYLKDYDGSLDFVE